MLLLCRSYYRLRRRASNEIESDNDQSNNHMVNQPPATMTIELINPHQVPLSRIWERIISLRRNSDRISNKVLTSEHGRGNSLDSQGRYAVNKGGSRQTVTVDNEFRNRAQSTPAGMMKVHHHIIVHELKLNTVEEACELVELNQPDTVKETCELVELNQPDTVKETCEHVELNQVLDNILNSEKDDSV